MLFGTYLKAKVATTVPVDTGKTRGYPKLSAMRIP